VSAVCTEMYGLRRGLYGDGVSTVIGSSGHIVIVDPDTASTLAQILPVLLLTLTVELRRTRLLQRHSGLRVAAFFVVFASIETVLVLSIDGAFYPFQWFDICSALIIFSLLLLVFLLSTRDGPAS
jgi:hypothetical protein